MSTGTNGTKRPTPGSSEVLHQRRNLPFSPMAMAIGGAAIVGAIAYFTLYVKSKPGTSPGDVATVTTTTNKVPSAADGGGRGGQTK